MPGRWTAEAIKELRKRYGETQAAFCLRLGVSPEALRVWEQGRGTPSGPAELLLDRLQEDACAGTIREAPA